MEQLYELIAHAEARKPAAMWKWMKTLKPGTKLYVNDYDRIPNTCLRTYVIVKVRPRRKTVVLKRDDWHQGIFHERDAHWFVSVKMKTTPHPNAVAAILSR